MPVGAPCGEGGAALTSGTRQIEWPASGKASHKAAKIRYKCEDAGSCTMDGVSARHTRRCPRPYYIGITTIYMYNNNDIHVPERANQTQLIK